MRIKPTKDEKVRIILTALWNKPEMVQHPLNHPLQKQYNKQMKQPMDFVDEQYETALKIINQRIASK